MGLFAYYASNAGPLLQNVSLGAYHMRDLSQLGIKGFGERPFPAITDASVFDFERAFHVSLPRAYVQFLRFANGGSLELCVYDDPVSGGPGGINDFYGLGNREDDERARSLGKWDYGNLWGEARIFRKFSPQPGIPFARDGGDNQLFLDYSEEIIRVSRLIFATKACYHIAQSFEEFLDLLRTRPTVDRVRSKNHEVRVRLPNKE